MRYKHTNRNGFLLGFIDFFTFGLFFLFYMPLGGLQDELDEILGHRTQRSVQRGRKQNARRLLRKKEGHAFWKKNKLL